MSAHFLLQEQKALREQVFGGMKPLPEAEYLQIYQSTGLDVDGRRAMVDKNKMRYELWYRKYISFAKSLPTFSDIPVADQINILKGVSYGGNVIQDFGAMIPFCLNSDVGAAAKVQCESQFYRFTHTHTQRHFGNISCTEAKRLLFSAFFQERRASTSRCAIT